MEKVAIDIAETLARLSNLTIFELRGEWRRLHRTPPPMRPSRDLLTRGITYKLQERADGRLRRRPSECPLTPTQRANDTRAGCCGRGGAHPRPPRAAPGRD